jgi:DNA-binding CsgD family transcriptional regulator
MQRADNHGQMTGAPQDVRLTERQRAVLALIGEGYSNQQIADALGISENGVKGHVARLLAKFQVPNRAGLVRAASGGGPDNSGGELLQVLQSSLEEVIGTTASSALIARAMKRAGVRRPDASEARPDLSMEAVTAVVAALWPLLIEMTGQVLVRRLEARGFHEGEIALGEASTWTS